ncbi:MAG: HlyC/CorC family transporter [Deltaproteobacteria bacterium]|nr:MAG: HlyC/CorC family transporter [Deltaproteobacteria bacterium]
MGDAPLPGIAGILGCLVFSAFFSGTETALTSLTPAHARRLIEEGGPGHQLLQRWIDEPLRVLTTILIGNNIFNVASSALATAVAQELLAGPDSHGAGINPVAAAVGVMTLLLLTFGEITPKTLARTHADRLAGPAMLLLLPFFYLLHPVASLFLRLTRILAGDAFERVGPFVREEDIEFLVRLGRTEGSLSADREKLLRSVFEFTDTTAREVMVPRTDVVAVPSDASEADLFERILAAGHSRVPVFEGHIDNIVGLCYAKDLLRFVGQRRGGETFDVSRYLRQANYVPETKPISELLREMQENRIHMAIVVDEFGGFSGIVTLEDIIEEFFGDILDEYDVEPAWSEPLGDRSWRLDARMHLDDVGELFDIEFPEEEDLDTLGGYLSKVMGEVAAEGAVVETAGIRFTVEQADARRVIRVRADWVGIDEDDEDNGEVEIIAHRAGEDAVAE